MTALLVRYASPLAAASLPREINDNPYLQAASPAFETARLVSMLGVGIDAIRAFAVILILSAALSVFVALYTALRERRHELAIMRTLGASRMKLFWLVQLEGVLLALIGAVVGIVLGHVAVELLGQSMAQARQMGVTGLIWLPQEWFLFLLAIIVGSIASLIPSLRAYRVDIASTLAR